VNDYRELVEKAGAFFLYERDGEIYFRDGVNGPTLRLYASSCRTVDDVVLALKSSRENSRLRDLNSWPLSGSVEEPASGGAFYERNI
jgi:hypothetical protein